MVGGQALDLQAAGQGPRGPAPPVAPDVDGLQAMHARKTGALIRASAAAGAIMAGAGDRLVAAVAPYAAELGLAFQIVEDVLDVEGSAQQLGKTAGKDLADGKPTYATLYGVVRSKALAAECAARARHALTHAGLADSHLAAIVDWVVSRRS
jgi:geranylgeranyl pyrophosphate synthase